MGIPCDQCERNSEIFYHLSILPPETGPTLIGLYGSLYNVCKRHEIWFLRDCKITEEEYSDLITLKEVMGE